MHLGNTSDLAISYSQRNIEEPHCLKKRCDAQIEVVNSQIVLYEIENGRLPDSISNLTSGDHPYLTEKQ